tara:strand:- start:5590 stop:6024 length:435 start_codon:yes stop_codon:yes gene_type:complete
MDINITEPKTDLDCVFLRNIRIRVFVIEQQIPWQWEFDYYDKIAIHILVKDQDKIIGTGRLFPYLGNDDYKLGRIAVLKEYRGNGIGTKILKHLELIARDKKVNQITLEAQSDKLNFYLKENYIIEGDKYVMDGIYHNLMSKKL